MTTILLSIKPQFVDKILSGDKKFEYRKHIPNQYVDKIIIYSTFPECRIVGEAKISNILSGTPADIWSQTHNQSGITPDFFFKYFNGKNVAFAYELGQIMKYQIPKKLSDFGVTNAPQSFIYIQ
ncbi:MAG: ASCH domain-containing protein [Alphaproteobacteria bacterium]|nr:ASCH domain-containing protein [Alphaproteobacteria bacterium]